MPITATKANSVGLGMSEYGLTTGLDKKCILGSGGAGDCIIVGAYNAADKKLFVMHVHRKTDLAKVAELIKQHIRPKKGNLDIYLSSQIYSTPNPGNSNLVRTVEALFTVKERMVIANRYPNTSMAIDAKTGEVEPGFDARTLGGTPSEPNSDPEPRSGFTAASFARGGVRESPF